MTGSLITISLIGLLAGIIFSMPIAGPISILITTNALKGRLRYCGSANIGASIATFTYVFFAVFGLTKLYPYYQPAIPYLLSAGSIFLLYLGYRIFRTKFDIENLPEEIQPEEKVVKKERGGFYTGCLINFLNPTLFIGWLSSTFLVISFVTSLGIDTGGLDIFVGQSFKEITGIEVNAPDNLKVLAPDTITALNNSVGPNSRIDKPGFPQDSRLLVSVFYALFIAIGSVLWFFFLILLISRFRRFINITFISRLVKSMAFVLSLFGLYFGYLAASILINIMS